MSYEIHNVHITTYIHLSTALRRSTMTLTNRIINELASDMDTADITNCQRQRLGNQVTKQTIINITSLTLWEREL